MRGCPAPGENRGAAGAGWNWPRLAALAVLVPGACLLPPGALIRMATGPREGQAPDCGCTVGTF